MKAAQVIRERRAATHLDAVEATCAVERALESVRRMNASAATQVEKSK